MSRKTQSQPPIPKTAAELAPAPYNPRKLSEQAGRALSYSMSEFGDLSGFVFNLRTEHLVAGHQRKEQIDPASKIVNYTEAPDDAGTVERRSVILSKSSSWGRLKQKENSIQLQG